MKLEKGQGIHRKVEVAKGKALWSIMVSLRETREAYKQKGRELQKEAAIIF